jgi:uncharacterized SAM-binding protein YcdF (DUF218 family)
VYSILSQLLEPYTLLVTASLILCLALSRLAKWRDKAGPVSVACFALLFLLSTPTAKFLALNSLERWYDVQVPPPTAVDTIVVLAGGMITEDAAGERVRLADTSLTRCLRALELYRQANGCRIILSGGKVNPAEPGPAYAESMRDFLVQCGVKEEDLVLESRSSTTYENALFSKELLGDQPGTIYLVTTAYHMWRSEGCFRRLGVDVVPAPCELHAQFYKAEVKALLPSTTGMHGVNDAAHEWIGLFWYWLTGRV